MPGSFTIQRSAKEEKLSELKACPGVCPGAFNKASTIHFSHDMKQIAIQLCNGIELDQVVHTHRTYRRSWTVDGSGALYTNSPVVTIESLRYGDYGLRLRLNMLLRMIKIT